MSLLVRLPVDAVITQLFGVNPTLGVVGNPNGTTVQRLVASYGNYQPYGHDGLDQGAAPGTTVYPMAAGHVDFAGLGQDMPKAIADKWAFIFGPGGWASGNIVLVDHRNGLGTYYAHNRRVLVRSGAEINEYTAIALSGGVPDEQPGSGRSGGPHVHTSGVLLDRVYVTPNYGRVDPLMYLPEGWSIPTAGGSTGAPAVVEEQLLPGMNDLPRGVTNMASPDETTNEQRLKDLHWQLCTDQGREYLAELIGGRGASKTLNTPIPRQGAMKGGGPVNLAQVVAWHDDGTLQILGKLAEVAATMGGGGASIDEIKGALKDLLATEVVTVDVKVNGKPEEAK